MNKAIKKIIALSMAIAMIPLTAVVRPMAAETDLYTVECGADGKVVITGSISPSNEKYFASLRVLKNGAELSELTGDPASDLAITDFIDQTEVLQGDTEFEFDFVLPDGESGKRAARLTGSSGESRDLTLYYIKTADYAAAAREVNAALGSFDTFKVACENGNNLFCLGIEEENADKRNTALKFMYESVKTQGISATDRLETIRTFEASAFAAAYKQGGVNLADYRSALKYFGDDVNEWADFVLKAPKALEKFQSFMSGASYSNLGSFGAAIKEGLILAVVRYPNGANNIGRVFKAFSDMTNIRTDSETAIYQKLSGNYNSLEAVLEKYSELKKSDNNTNKFDGASGGGGESGSTVSVNVPSSNGERDISVKPLKIQFADLDIADWAYEAITSLAERGIVSGRTNTTFAPLEKVTREEFVKLLVCAAGYENLEFTSGRFTDVPVGSWYEKYVCIAAESGLVYGIEKDRFGVGENVTRQDMLVMIYRALSKKNTAPAAAEPEFADTDAIADYAKSAVGALSGGGYINGVGDNKFNPKGTATRAETAQMLYNVITLLSGGNTEDENQNDDSAQSPGKQSASAAQDKNYENAFSLLSSLGIYDNGLLYEKTEADGAVTRGDFAVYFARLMNIDNVGVSEFYYTDVPKSHYAFDEIGALTKYGYISETEDKKFRPDDPISSQEASMTAIKGIGLSDMIKSGYTDEAFIRDAMREAGISYYADGDLTFRDMTMMMYNVLLADCYKLTSTGMYSKYSKTDGNSLLYETRKMRFVKKGFLTAANGMDIYGAKTNANSVVIDGTVFSSGNKNYSRFLGRNVDYVYSDEDGLTLCWAAEKDGSGSGEITLTIGNNGGYDPQKNEFWYYENNRERHVKIANSAIMVYNGRPLSGGAEDILSRPKTKVTLLSSEDRNIYDIVLIDGYENMIVTGKNSDTYAVFDKNSSKSIRLEAALYECFSIEDTVGIERDWSEIQDGAVLSIFQSQDGQCLRVVVSEDTITGNVSGIDDSNYVVINDETYEVYSDEVLTKLSAGMSVTCYLDCFGYIAEVQTQASSDRFVGFALNGFCDYERGDAVLGMHILSETGNIEYYETNGKININGETYKDIKTAFAKLTENGEFKPQIMLCKLSGDGKLTRIDTASPDDGGVHPLTINREIKKDLEKVEHGMYAGGRIGVNMLTNSNTKVFSVPENIGSDFSRCFVSSLRMWDDYRGAVSYRTTSEDTFYEQYIVTRQITYGDTAANHAIQMIDKIYTSVDDNDEIVQNIVYTTGAGTSEAAVAKYLDLDAYNLKRGDAVRLATTASNKNQVEYVSIVSRAGENTAVGESLRETPYATRTISAYAYDKLGYAVKLGWDSGDTFDEIIQINSGTPIAVYDSERNEVRIGTIEDIKTYRSDGEASRLLIQSYQGNLQRVFVYR